MPAPNDPDALTPRQDKFARIYATTGKKQRAAIEAGYKPKNAHVTAHHNLKKAKITKAVALYRRRSAERLDVSKDKLINDAAHDAEQASAKGQFLAANNARTFVAKALGYITDRSLNVNIDMTASHLDALKALTNRADSHALQIVEAVTEPVEMSPELVGNGPVAVPALPDMGIPISDETQQTGDSPADHAAVMAVDITDH